MTMQVALRLPDELVGFMDQLVRRGEAPSRASVVTRALEHEQRRITALRDAQILAQSVGLRDEFDDLAEYAARLPMDLD